MGIIGRGYIDRDDHTTPINNTVKSAPQAQTSQVALAFKASNIVVYPSTTSKTEMASAKSLNEWRTDLSKNLHKFDYSSINKSFANAAQALQTNDTNSLAVNALLKKDIGGLDFLDDLLGKLDNQLKSGGELSDVDRNFLGALKEKIDKKTTFTGGLFTGKEKIDLLKKASADISRIIENENKTETVPSNDSITPNPSQPIPRAVENKTTSQNHEIPDSQPKNLNNQQLIESARTSNANNPLPLHLQMTVNSNNTQNQSLPPSQQKNEIIYSKLPGDFKQQKNIDLREQLNDALNLNKNAGQQANALSKLVEEIKNTPVNNTMKKTLVEFKEHLENEPQTTILKSVLNAVTNKLEKYPS